MRTVQSCGVETRVPFGIAMEDIAIVLDKYSKHLRSVMFDSAE